MGKICAIHQPNFLPWLGYFYKIANSDIFIILDTVDIEIGTSKAITNRTRIKTNTGVNWITEPIKKGDSKKINNIEIINNNWKKKSLKTIYFQYNKSKFFDTIYPILEKIINYNSNKLSDYNTNAIKVICNFLNIDTEIILASELKVDATTRNQRIVDICKSCDCSTYLSGKGGEKYHDHNLFELNKIDIKITDFKHPKYNQLHGDFVPGLSIIDFLFSNSKEDLMW